jgi:EAL domain-containing protein (putative c-di-GMP-specific phosphodiesterase class I)
MQEIIDHDGYPATLVQHLQGAINKRDQYLSSNFINIMIENMPMIISGFGFKICEEVVNNLLKNIKDYLHNNGLDPLIMRLQKDQIGIFLSNNHSAFSDDNLRSLLQNIKDFTFASEYGTVHVIPSQVNIELPPHQIEASDLLTQSYIQLKSKRNVLHNNLIGNQVDDAANSRSDMSLVNYINNAIKSGQICMAFQPIICAKTGDISHHEALLRVRGANGQLTSAGPLIPVAERMGLIDIIDELVLQMMVQELLDDGDLNVSFNVSNLTANSPAWLAMFEKIASKHPEIITRMMIEITETAVHLDLNKTAYFIASLQAQGAKVALDDFGSGYTSFRQLKSLSLDMIKIDGMFVQGLTTNNDNKLFVKTMLDFTHGFGLETVAECIEDGETAKMLMQLGIDYMQGYYFGYPEIKTCDKLLKNKAHI